MKRILMMSLCTVVACSPSPERSDETATEADPPTIGEAIGPDAPEVEAPDALGEAGPEPEVEDTGTGEPDDTETDDPAPTEAVDVIYGVEIPRAESYWVEDGLLFRGDDELTLRGISWFGFDTTDHALHGLWTGQTTTDILDRVEALGFNALRIPLSPESLRSDTALPSWSGIEDSTTAPQLLEHLLVEAAQRELYVLLDHHTCSSSAGHLASSPVACSGYTEADWLGDLERMAELSNDHENIVGIDLFNEPYGLTWPEWRAMSEEAAARVLQINPRVLVFVQGVGDRSRYGEHNPFWGENLYEATTDAPDIPTARLVYSPHTYGPSVYEQSYFSDASFPTNMPTIWDQHFGHLVGIHPVVPGEFGGHHTGQDAVWQEAFVDYMVAADMRSFFYWSLNPNSGDTGGILLDDWETVDAVKLETLAPLLEPADR